MDLVSTKLGDAWSFWILTVVDQSTRECVVIWGKLRLNGSDAAEVLDMAARERGKPTSISLDNGSELARGVIGPWADSKCGLLALICPRKPLGNAFIESFNGRLRDECLNTESFNSMAEVRGKLAAWRYDCNHRRAQSALDDQTRPNLQPRSKRPEEKARPSGRAFFCQTPPLCVRAYSDSNHPLPRPGTMAKGHFRSPIIHT